MIHKRGFSIEFKAVSDENVHISLEFNGNCGYAGNGALPTARDPKSHRLQDQLLRYHGYGA